MPDEQLRERVRALVGSLFDDAAVFPPASTPLPEAVAGHRGHRRSWYADLVGSLLCPTSRVPQLLDALPTGDALDPIPVTLVADSGVLGVEQARNLLLDDDRLELVGLEIALPRDGDPAVFARYALDALTFAVPTAVEVPPVPGWQEALDVLAEDGAERAKLRLGGPAAADVPSPQLLATMLHAVVARRVPFTVTAGLHHALRGAEATDGVAHHGFLNVIAATAAALDGGRPEELAAVLASAEAAPVLAALACAPPARVRHSLTAVGTCSIAEPVADLLALGLLEGPDG